MSERTGPDRRRGTRADRRRRRRGADHASARRTAGHPRTVPLQNFPDKNAVEAQVITLAMRELASALAQADSLDALAATYRAYALAHPHLYRLMNSGPLPRHLLPPGVEEATALPLVRAVGGEMNRARAVWAFAHGMVILELDGRFPPDADLDNAWHTGLAAFANRPLPNLASDDR